MSYTTQKANATATCVICGNMNPPHRKTCSKLCQRECVSRARRGRVSYTHPIAPSACDVCGRLFVRRARKDKGKYCDMWCKNEGMRRLTRLPIKEAMSRNTDKCETCGKVLIGQGKRFCSNKCAGVRLVTRTCDVCGGRVKQRHVSCQHCGTRLATATHITPCVKCGRDKGAKDNRVKYCASCAASNKRLGKRARKALRRARKKAATNIERIDPRVVYQRDKGICQLCGKRVRANANPQSNSGASLDHIIPLSKGGDHTYKNIQLAHRGCNSKQNVSVRGKQLRLI